MNDNLTVKPLEGFEALDGCHCITASLKKVCAFYDYEISEEMLLGLGAGVGIFYWHQKGTLPFLGGRGNHKNFNADLSARTGIKVEEHFTSSERKAERELVALLEVGHPVMIFADMGFLPYFDFGEEYHFGGHAVVVAGYDAASRQVLIADMAPDMPHVKSGSFYQMSMEELTRARGSKYKPYPPKNQWLTFDFSAAHPPDRAAIYAAIVQNVDGMLNPPIKNAGVAGINTAAKRIKKWQSQLDEHTFKAALFNIYVFVEIGGTGGGLFRYMYSRFLAEAAKMTGEARLRSVSEELHRCGESWSALVQPLKQVYEMDDPAAVIADLVEDLGKVAEMEDKAWRNLQGIVA